MQARQVLAALGTHGVELATWVQPRAKPAKAAGAAAVAGPAVKAGAKAQSNNGSSSSLLGQAHLPAHLHSLDWLAGGSDTLSLCL